MGYSIIILVVVGLFENCLLTKLIHGAHTFTGPKALPWERNVCGSPFECLGLALIVVLLFGNIHGQRNIRPTTTARIKPTTTARITPTKLAQITPTTTTPSVCGVGYSLYSEECGRFCYRFETSVCREWSDARRVCQDEGGDLFEPSECIFPFIRELARRNSGICAEYLWLGAQRPAKENNFLTVRGDQIPNKATFWGRFQPNNNNEEQTCVEMGIAFDFMANDEDCKNRNGFICQKIII